MPESNNIIYFPGTLKLPVHYMTAIQNPMLSAEEFKETRIKLGFSQKYIGKLFGVCKSTIYRWEKKKYNICK